MHRQTRTMALLSESLELRTRELLTGLPLFQDKEIMLMLTGKSLVLKLLTMTALRQVGQLSCLLPHVDKGAAWLPPDGTMYRSSCTLYMYVVEERPVPTKLMSASRLWQARIDVELRLPALASRTVTTRSTVAAQPASTLTFAIPIYTIKSYLIHHSREH